MTNVLIVEDERLIQDLFARYIESVNDRYKLIDTIRDAKNTEVMCKCQKIDLILMDICTANNSSGLDAAKRIKEVFPHIKIIIVTSAPEYRFIEKAKKAKVESFWYKELSKDELMNVMDRTMQGESVYPDKTPEVEIGAATSYDFTPKELEVLRYLAEGISARAVSERMGITINGVNEHIKHLKEKTGCSSKTQLAVLATRTRLVLPEY